METTESVQAFILVTRTSGVECVQRGLQEMEPWTNMLSAEALVTLGKNAVVFHDSAYKRASSAFADSL